MTSFTENTYIPHPGELIPDGDHKGARILVTIQAVHRDLQKTSWTVCRVARGAVTYWVIAYAWIGDWGEELESLDLMDYMLDQNESDDDYVYVIDRLYPIFPPRLMQNLDTGEHDKKDPNLDYTSGIRFRRIP